MLRRGPQPRSTRCRRIALPCMGLLLLAASAGPAWAWVDIFDRGPALVAGKFNLRVTNAGVVGNAFPRLSFDPSFESPKGTGQELMNYAALWVGALNAEGRPRVSGGPLLEFRPTMAPEDTVRQLWHGRIGSRRAEDDDGDGRVDEERYNGRDDDGDGEIDEDMGVIGQQMLIADYTDDQPEAINFEQAGGENHQALGLTVHQEAYAWTWPGYDGIAGLQYTITNHGVSTLREVYIGLYVDLDVRAPGDPGDRPNDAIGRVSFSRSYSKGTTRVFENQRGYVTYDCFSQAGRAGLPFVDEPPGSRWPNLPVVAVLPLGHTTDPMGLILPQYARAPGRDSFRASLFAGGRDTRAGGPPILDEDRYAALRGEWPQSPDTHTGNQQILVSCGPFATLAPGQSLDFAVALVAAKDPDSLQSALGNAAFLYSGTELNLVPDAVGPQADWWSTGETGVSGHEACIEVPLGVEFEHDPHCVEEKWGKSAPGYAPRVYRYGPCIWTDVDCDMCTGINGRETVMRWADLQNVPPSPTYRVTPGDHSVRIEWDNLPEILINAGQAGPPGGTFIGYRLYRLADWRFRGSLTPPRENWAALATYGYDDDDSKVLISTVTDSTLESSRIWYEQKHYPVGRYAVVDPEPLNGFDYLYHVTSVVETRTPFSGFTRVNRYESPLAVTFRERAVPRVEARTNALGVWVVPNPFRGSADWDRPPTLGDRHTRHLDFMGLPRARSTIRIWTVAGDHVATLDHDGTGGSGQAAWNLVSRNGQEVASGIYVFTVESPVGNATGRFVVIR